MIPVSLFCAISDFSVHLYYVNFQLFYFPKQMSHNTCMLCIHTNFFWGDNQTSMTACPTSTIVVKLGLIFSVDMANLNGKLQKMLERKMLCFHSGNSVDISVPDWPMLLGHWQLWAISCYITDCETVIPAAADALVSQTPEHLLQLGWLFHILKCTTFVPKIWPAKGIHGHWCWCCIDWRISSNVLQASLWAPRIVNKSLANRSLSMVAMALGLFVAQN